MTSSFNIPPPFGTKSRACLERHGIYLRKPANLFWTFRMFRKGLKVLSIFECSLDVNGRAIWSINIRLIVRVIYCVQSCCMGKWRQQCTKKEK